MRQILTLLLLTTAITLSAQWGNRKTIKGNGEMKTETRDVQGFDGISTCCDINVEIVKGNFDVRVKAESNLQDYIETKVQGGRLKICYKDNVNVRSKKQVTVFVSLPELEYVGASSSGTVTTKSSFSGEEMEVDVSSGAKIMLDFSGDYLYTNASSGGGITLKGSADRFKANVSSGGKIRGEDYQAKNARCDASSGGGVTVKVSGELNADASSGGWVRYHGSPTDVDSDTSSGGSVRRGN